jgi:type II secretion system protein I
LVVHPQSASRNLQSTRRRGLSLLEVLVALAIFLMSMIVIGQLITLGGDRALDVQNRGLAAQLCQSKLAEVVAGVVPLESQPETPFEEDSTWLWSLDCEPHAVPGLWSVTVHVTRQQAGPTRVGCSLSQVVLDPAQRGSTADVVQIISGTSSSTGSGGSTGGTGGSTGGSATPGSSSSPPASTPAPAGATKGGR